MVRIASHHRSRDHANPRRPNPNLPQSEELEPLTQSLALLSVKRQPRITFRTTEDSTCTTSPTLASLDRQFVNRAITVASPATFIEFLSKSIETLFKTL